jgi:hypothetical protein
MRTLANKKYVFKTALILTLLYVSALLPLGGFVFSCDASDCSIRGAENIGISLCCCPDTSCSEKAGPAYTRAEATACATHSMCCCSSADASLDVQSAVVKDDRRSSLKDERCAIVLPSAFMPQPEGVLSFQTMRHSICRSPVSPHIPTTILLL